MPLPNQQHEGRGDSWRGVVLLHRIGRYVPKYLFPEQKPTVPDTTNKRQSLRSVCSHQNARFHWGFWTSLLIAGMCQAPELTLGTCAKQSPGHTSKLPDCKKYRASKTACSAGWWCYTCHSNGGPDSTTTKILWMQGWVWKEKESGTSGDQQRNFPGTQKPTGCSRTFHCTHPQDRQKNISCWVT